MFLIPIYARCIPYTLKEDAVEEGAHAGKQSCQQDVVGRLQVLMISTPKRSDLIFPKVIRRTRAARSIRSMAIPYSPFNQSCVKNTNNIQYCIYTTIY
jgi:hypothetical protein